MKEINIALVAHDGRKKELIDWVKFNWKMLAKYNIMLIFFCDNLIVQGHQNRETYIGCGGSSGGYRFCEDSVGIIMIPIII